MANQEGGGRRLTLCKVAGSDLDDIFNAVSTNDVAILLGLFVASQLRGQGVQVEPGISLGVTVPTGDFHADAFRDGFRLGWQGTLLVDLQGPSSRLGFRLEGSYGQNGSNDKLTSDFSVTNSRTTATTKLTGGSVDVTYNLALPASIIADYLVGGIGAYDVKLCLTGSFNGCKSVTKGGWNFGGRVVHRVARRAAWFVEVRYFDVGGGDFYAVSVRPKFLLLTAGIQFLRPIDNY